MPQTCRRSNDGDGHESKLLYVLGRFLGDRSTKRNYPLCLMGNPEDNTAHYMYEEPHPTDETAWRIDMKPLDVTWSTILETCMKNSGKRRTRRLVEDMANTDFLVFHSSIAGETRERLLTVMAEIGPPRPDNYEMVTSPTVAWWCNFN